jgi:hypothetical protein
MEVLLLVVMGIGLLCIMLTGFAGGANCRLLHSYWQFLPIASKSGGCIVAPATYDETRF